MHGYPRALQGAALSRYSWPKAWFRRKDTRRLPNFRLNLFIQAKRPEWSNRPTKVLRTHGFTGIYWRFHIERHQQRALALVARTLQARALVVYAAPAFHLHQDLFAHTRKGSLVQHSTFPSIAALAGHSAWNYQKPGAVGIANADPTPIEEDDLGGRIATLLESDHPEQSWRQELKSLANSLKEALSDEELAETSRRAAFFDLLRQSERSAEDLEQGEILVAYETVLAFCEAYALEWLVLSK